MLLVVDALADFGRSGGVDGARQQPRRDDAGGVGAGRALRPPRRPGRAAGGRRGGRSVGSGAGQRHLRRSSAGSPASGRPGCATTTAGGCACGATAGTVVIVLSPLMSEVMGTATATAAPARPAGAGRRHPARARRGARAGGHRPAGGRPGVAAAPHRARPVPDRPGPRGLPGGGLARARAPSTTCCTGWPAARSCPRCACDELRLAGAGPAGSGLLRAVVAARAAGGARSRAGRRDPPPVWLVAARCWCSRPGGRWRRSPWSARWRCWWSGSRGPPAATAACRPARCVAAVAMLAAHLAALVVSYGPRRAAGRRRPSYGCGLCAASASCSPRRSSGWWRAPSASCPGPSTVWVLGLAVGAVGDGRGRGGRHARPRCRTGTRTVSGRSTGRSTPSACCSASSRSRGAARRRTARSPRWSAPCSAAAVPGWSAR